MNLGEKGGGVVLSCRSSRFLLAVCSFPLIACGSLLAQTAPAKLPIPSETAQAEALKLASAVYGADFAKAKTAELRVELAQEMIRKSAEAKDDPAARFILLRVATDVGAQAGNANVAIKAIEEMAVAYDINAPKMKIEALAKASQAAKTAKQHEEIVSLASLLIATLVAEDRLDEAKDLGTTAEASAQQAKNPDLLNDTIACTAELEEIAKAYSEVKPAMAALEKAPTDPAANLAVGKYLCFVKGDWDRGIPMLALGNREPLKSLAVTELQGLASWDDRVKLADGWWDLAESETGIARKHLQRRAVHWYRPALPFIRGLSRDRVAKRVAELADVSSSPSADPERDADVTRKDGWIQIFRNQSLKGWKADQNGGIWSVSNGALVGRGTQHQASHLYYDGSFADFELRAEVRINATGNSGLFFRSQPALRKGSPCPVGYEVQIIGSRVKTAGRTGTILATRRQLPDTQSLAVVHDNLAKDGQWFQLHIVAKGYRITVAIDGRMVVDVTDSNHWHRSGLIAVQQYRADTIVSFRNLEVKPLR